MNAIEIITGDSINRWQIQPDGQGAYDFPYEGDEVVLFKKSQRAFLITDRWCGGSVEGWCYRIHFLEVNYEDGVEAVLCAARGAEPLIDESNDGRRFRHAPIWLKDAIKRTQVRDALTDEELGAAIKEEMVGK
jgi:hypothetical protein